MVFRFGSAVALVVLISLAGVALEKQTLSLRRALSRQHFRAARLEEQRERLRMTTQQLSSPRRLQAVLQEQGRQSPGSRQTAESPRQRVTRD